MEFDPDYYSPCQIMNDYQTEARKTAVYVESTHTLIGRLSYATLKLNKKAEEVAEKVKKIIRNNNGVIDEETKIALVKELGDVLWYLADIATNLDVKLSVVAELNLAKLADRHKRNVIASEGDNR